MLILSRLLPNTTTFCAYAHVGRRLGKEAWPRLSADVVLHGARTETPIYRRELSESWEKNQPTKASFLMRAGSQRRAPHYIHIRYAVEYAREIDNRTRARQILACTCAQMDFIIQGRKTRDTLSQCGVGVLVREVHQQLRQPPLGGRVVLSQRKTGGVR